MLESSSQFRRQAERILDAAIALVALSLAAVARREIRAALRWRVMGLFDFWPQAGWLYVLVVLMWIILFDACGLYKHKSVRTPERTFAVILQANVIGVVLVFFTFYIVRIKNVPRLLLLLFAGIDFLLMCGKEIFLRRLRKLWTMRPNIVLVGLPAEFASLAERFRNLPQWKPNILGILSPSVDTGAERSARDMDNVGPDLGKLERLPEILHEHSVDYVVLSPKSESFEDIQQTISICETEGVEAWLIADFFRTSIARAQVDEFQEFPMLTFSTTPEISWALWAKRVMDFFGSLILLVLLSPLMLALFIAIRLTSPGPAIFRQERCTVRGRKFWMYKFRSMVTEAENLRAELESRNEMEGPVFKIKKDPRVTRVGALLRRHSLDELPQLYNVLKGDMSLVGPRPPVPPEVDKYANWQRRRLSMRSGITCLWQISGRNTVDFEEWMRLDLKYIDNWSLLLDLRILLKTILVVLRGTGY